MPSLLLIFWYSLESYLFHGDHIYQFKYEPYNVGFTLLKFQKNLRIFLNTTVLLNLAGCGDITYFLKRNIHFKAISFQCGCIPSFHFLQPSTSFIRLCFTHYFKVNCKANHLAVIINTM